jgi:hypothetical protein
MPHRSRALLLTAFALCLLASLLGPGRAWALVTFRSSASAGVYRDVFQESHAPVSLDWELTQLGSDGLETVLDLGADNSVVLDQWHFFPYQAFVTIPLEQSFEPRRSRIQLGRQLLTEGFDFGLFDGVNAPVYWSLSPSRGEAPGLDEQEGGFTAFAGGLRVLEDLQLGFDSRLYGASAHQRFLGTRFKAGTTLRQSVSRDVLHSYLSGELSRRWPEAPLAPSVLAMQEWQLDSWHPDQARLQAQLEPLPELGVAGTYDYRLANDLGPADSSLLYRLFAVSPERSWGASTSLRISEAIQVSARARQFSYEDAAGGEQGSEQELSCRVSLDRDRSLGTLTPALTHLTSYGGALWQFGLDYERALGSLTELLVRGSLARIEKLNQISGLAYYARTSLNLRLGPKVLALGAVELERNYFFDFNARAVAYLSYFYY